MKRVFLDTNIIIDYIDARANFVEEATKIFNMAEREDVSLYASTLSFSNIAYILRKHNIKEIKEIFQNLCVIIDALPVDTNVLKKAINSPFTDFEDALQYFCAENGMCDYLITRNLDDYIVEGNVTILTPIQFIEEVK